MIISIVNHKGGTGKTTTAINLAAALTRLEKKVLLIDLDAQSNASASTPHDPTLPHVGEVVLGKAKISEAIQAGRDFDLICSHSELYSYELQLAAEFDKAFFMKDVLKGIKGQYDYIFVDCPPTLSDLVLCALTGSDGYIVPMQGENYAYAGLAKLFSMAERLKKLNPGLQLIGIIMHRFNLRTKFGQMLHDQLQKDKLPLFKTQIRQDISIMESGYMKQSLFDYAPESNGATDYTALANELITLTQTRHA